MKKRPETLDDIFAAAKQHGIDSDPDHEVGDLQDALRQMYRMLTPPQRRRFLTEPTVIQNFRIGMGAV